MVVDISNPNLRRHGPGGITVLMQCASEGREDDVAALLAAGADVDAVDRFGSTALIFASTHGHTGVVRILIEAHADINFLTRNYLTPRGLTPLSWACQSGPWLIAKILLEAGADYTWTDHYYLSLEQGQRRILRLLVEHGAPISTNATDIERCERNESAFLYHDKVKAAGGYDALVKKHRTILASVVDKVVEAKFGRRAPREVCEHVGAFVAPPGGS
jgi:ankyrin repeat protein